MKHHPTVLRVAALLLLAAIFFLCSCESTGQQDPSDPASVTTDAGGTTSPSGDETVLVADVPSLDLPEALNYGGRIVRMVTNENTAKTRKPEEKDDGSLFREELRNEVVNDAIYNRQLWVEDRLGVELVNVPATTTVREYVERMVQSNDSDVDIAAASCARTAWSSQYGYYLDLTGCENLNMLQPWWSGDFIKESSFGGRTYFLTGDLSLELLRRTYVVYFNKRLAEDHGITGVYDLVFDGTWTIDKLSELSAGVYVDVNGNSEYDMEDIYGFLTEAANADPLWSAFDIDIVSKDADDYLLYSPDIEKYGIAYEKVRKLFYAESTCFKQMDVWPDAMFASGNGVFAEACLSSVESERFRNMPDEYGVLPLPKFDESQKEYYTMPHDQYTIFGIPATSPDPELSAAVLEAMSWYSAAYVKPAYLNVALKGQYANDPETRQIMDMVVNGIKIDAAWIYAYCLDDYPQMWRTSLAEGLEEYASTFAKKERNLKILLRTLNETYAALP